MLFQEADHAIDFLLDVGKGTVCVVAIRNSGIGMHLKSDVIGLAFRLSERSQRFCQMAIPAAIAVGSGIGADDEIALGVVASGGPDGADEALGIAVNGVVGGCGHSLVVLAGCGEGGVAPRAEAVQHLIISLKEEAFAVIAELLGNLLPEFLIADAVLGVVGFVGFNP